MHVSSPALTLQIMSWYLQLRDVEAADLTQQLLVVQTAPGAQCFSRQRWDGLWHEHASVCSVSREQNVSEAAALNARSRAAVTHPTGTTESTFTKDVLILKMFLHQVCRNMSLHQCLSNGCSAVNGCRQNESPNS